MTCCQKAIREAQSKMLRCIFFIIVILLSTKAAASPYKRAEVAERRARIMRNGNINNRYPKKFQVEWFIVNNKAYMGLRFRGF